MELNGWVGVGVALVAILLLSRVFFSSHQSSAALVPAAKGKEEDESERKKKKKRAVFLNRERQRVPLVEKISLSHDVRLFRFALPFPDMELGLPIGKHIKVFAPNVKGVKEGEWNGRPDPGASLCLSKVVIFFLFHPSPIIFLRFVHFTSPPQNPILH